MVTTVTSLKNFSRCLLMRNKKMADMFLCSSSTTKHGAYAASVANVVNVANVANMVSVANVVIAVHAGKL